MPLIRKKGLERIKIRQQKEKDKQKIKGITRKFQLDDKVLVKRSEIGKISKPFGEKWLGPYKVVQIYDYGAYVLEDEMGVMTKPINGDRMKLYFERKNLEPIVVIESINTPPEIFSQQFLRK